MTQSAGHSLYGSEPAPMLLAHRGGPGLGQENTLEAFAASQALGIRYLETDAQVTKDGVAVAFHDFTLRRLTGRPERISSLTWAQLSKVVLPGGGQIPRLDTVLNNFDEARISIDVKSPGVIEPLVAAIRGTRSQSRVCLAGGWDGWLHRARHGCGDPVRSTLGWAGLTRLICAARSGTMPLRRSFIGEFAHVPWVLGRQPVMADARLALTILRIAERLGLRVIVWTVNEPQQMSTLLDLGVAGIVTDRPDVGREVLLARGQWEPMHGHLPARQAEPVLVRRVSPPSMSGRG